MESKPTLGRARLALIGLVVLCVAAIGVWTLVAGSTAMGSLAVGPSTSSPTSAQAYSPPSAHSPANPLCSPNWVVVSSPNVGTYDNIIYAVSAVSASDVWAVGSYTNGTVYRTLVEHWNGSVWVIVFSPNVDTYDSYLHAVSAVSASDAWAAGYYRTGGGVSQTLIEHWNGAQWSVVNSPNVGTDNNSFSGVAATSSSDAWAVGTYRTGGVYQTLVEHWNGSVWAIVFSPNVGTTDNYLLAISAVSSSDVWAVGDYVGTVYQTLTEHWDGTQWSIVPSPGGGTNETDLLGVAAISSSDAWAVGDISSNAGYRTLTEHWNGSVWAIVSSPNGFTYQNYLYAISAISSSNAWAVGYYDDNMGEHTLVEHWNGTQWSVVNSPDGGTNGNYLRGVAAVSATDVWAVGYNANNTTFQTLAERYNPCTSTSTPTPASTPTACSIQFSDVPQGSTFYPFIRCLACRGIINGYADGTFKPNNNVTRGQLSKIVSNAAGFNNPQPHQMFQDVPVGSTFQVFIGRLASRGYINGYPCGGAGEPCLPPTNLPYFRPNNNATRGQISKIDANAAGFSDTPSGRQFEDVPIGSTYYTYTYRLVSRGVMGGYPCGGAGEPCIPPANLPYFRPNNNATRGQTSKIVANTFFPNCQTPARK